MNSEKNTNETFPSLINYYDVDKEFDSWLCHLNKYDNSEDLRYIQFRALEHELEHIFSELERVEKLLTENVEDFPYLADEFIVTHVLMAKIGVIIMRIFLMKKTSPLFADKKELLEKYSERIKRLTHGDYGYSVRWPFFYHTDKGTHLLESSKFDHPTMILEDPDFFYFRLSDLLPSILIKSQYMKHCCLSNGEYYPKFRNPCEFVSDNMESDFSMLMFFLRNNILDNINGLHLDNCSFLDELVEFKDSDLYESIIEQYNKVIEYKKDDFIKALRKNPKLEPFIDSYEDALLRDDLDSLGSEVASESFEDWVNLLTVAALLQDNEEKHSAPISDALICKAIIVALSVYGRRNSAKWVGIYFAWKKEPRLPEEFKDYQEFMALMNGSRFKDARTETLKGKKVAETGLRDYCNIDYLNNTAIENWTQDGWNRVDTPKIKWDGVEVAKRAAMKFKETLDGGADTAA